MVELDEVLVATGRRPNNAGLGLSEAGIEVTEHGAIKVGDDLQTTNPRVWAAGDVTAHAQFVFSKDLGHLGSDISILACEQLPAAVQDGINLLLQTETTRAE